MTRFTALALAFAVATPLAAAPTRDEATVNKLVDDFLAAERNYDPAALTRLITPDFVEISPKGEVDAHDRFLGFYAPANRQDVPPLTVSERNIRVAGATALAIVRLSYALPGRPEPMAVRATYVARRANGAWRLAGTQFTAIRP